jgi:hypothetical protein
MRAVGGGGPAREGDVGKSGSTSRSRATCLEPRFGRRRSGGLDGEVEWRR